MRRMICSRPHRSAHTLGMFFKNEDCDYRSRWRLMRNVQLLVPAEARERRIVLFSALIHILDRWIDWMTKCIDFRIKNEKKKLSEIVDQTILQKSKGKEIRQHQNFRESIILVEKKRNRVNKPSEGNKQEVGYTNQRRFKVEPMRTLVGTFQREVGGKLRIADNGHRDDVNRLDCPKRTRSNAEEIESSGHESDREGRSERKVERDDKKKSRMRVTIRLVHHMELASVPLEQDPRRKSRRECTAVRRKNRKLYPTKNIEVSCTPNTCTTLHIHLGALIFACSLARVPLKLSPSDFHAPEEPQHPPQ